MSPEELSDRLWRFAARVGKVVDALPNGRLGRHGLVVREGSHGSRGRSPHPGGRCPARRLILLVAGLLGAALAAPAGTTDGLAIGWTNNMLSISSPNIPGGKVNTWYLEAFCRSGSTHRDWHQTTNPHKTE